MKLGFRKFALALALVLPSVSQSWADDAWRHAYLKSAEGFQIQLDFQTHAEFNCAKCNNPIYAAPIWINVAGQTLSGRESVLIKLRNYKRPYGQDGEFIESEQALELEYAGHGRYTAELKSFEIATVPYAGADVIHQELEVEITGRAFEGKLLDPVSRTQKFQLSLSQIAK